MAFKDGVSSETSSGVEYRKSFNPLICCGWFTSTFDAGGCDEDDDDESDDESFLKYFE